MRNRNNCPAVSQNLIPAGGAGGAISPPSFEDLGKIKFYWAVRSHKRYEKFGQSQEILER